MSYSLTWDQVRKIGDRFLESWENRTFEWDNWDRIKSFVTEAAEQARLAALHTPNARPGAPNGGAPRQNPAKPGNPRGGPPKKWITDIAGVPWSYMKGKDICCQFNSGDCLIKGDHKVGESLVHHWCGGCFASSKGVTKSAHKALDCKKGPFNDKSLFA